MITIDYKRLHDITKIISSLQHNYDSWVSNLMVGNIQFFCRCCGNAVTVKRVQRGTIEIEYDGYHIFSHDIVEVLYQWCYPARGDFLDCNTCSTELLYLVDNIDGLHLRWTDNLGVSVV